MNMNWIAVAGAAGLVLLAVVAFWALSFSTGGEPADENPDSASVPSPDRAPTAVVDTNAPLTTEEIVAAASPATVSVTCPNTIGSGFFVTAEMLLTNAHVVCEGTDTVVVHFADGSTLEGWVRQRNEEWDLASVEVRGANVEPLPPGDASRLRAGQKIVVIGTPLGMAYSVHEGIISNTGRHMFGVNYLQIDANINPGNSGGPLLNEHGQVVGVVSMKTGEGIGFALPINYAYAGATPFFHASIPISDSWRETVTRMAEEEEREAQKARSAFIRPGLVHIEPVPPTIAVVVIMRSIVRPSAMDLRAYVDVDGIEHCRGDVRIRGWGSLEAVGASVTDGSFDAQLRWLEKHGIADDIWFGAGELDRQSCPGVLRASGGELVLEQGEEGYDRMRIGIR
jgi:serine protease Do